MVSDRTADEVLAALPPDERAAVERFRDAVRERLGERLRDLRIYGSKARGDWHEDSDIDLLVLIDGCDYKLSLEIYRLARSIDWRLEAQAFDEEEYHLPVNRASGYYKEMRKESVRL